MARLGQLCWDNCPIIREADSIGYRFPRSCFADISGVFVWDLNQTAKSFTFAELMSLVMPSRFVIWRTRGWRNLVGLLRAERLRDDKKEGSAIAEPSLPLSRRSRNLSFTPLEASGLGSPRRAVAMRLVPARNDPHCKYVYNRSSQLSTICRNNALSGAVVARW